MTTQKLFVNENVPAGTAIGFLPGLGRSNDFYSFDIDSDSDGISSIEFDRATETFVVVDADELDHEGLISPILELNFWFSDDETQGAVYEYGYNVVEIYVQDIPNESFNGTNANNYLVDTDYGNTFLRGYKGNDRLIGGYGDETLIGGQGRDVVTGGSGADSFIFGDGKKFSKKLKADRITDFDTFSDTLVFDRKTFGNRLQFESVSSSFEGGGKASTSKKTLVFDYAKGALYFNENRAKPGYGKGGLIATFDNTLDGDLRVQADNCRMGTALI